MVSHWWNMESHIKMRYEISVLLLDIFYCMPGPELGLICVAWDGNNRSIGCPCWDELGACLGVGLQAALESWQEHQDLLYHSEKETGKWENEVAGAFSGHPSLHQRLWGRSHWASVIQGNQLGVKFWSQPKMLLYVIVASLLGSLWHYGAKGEDNLTW